MGVALCTMVQKCVSPKKINKNGDCLWALNFSKGRRGDSLSKLGSSSSYYYYYYFYHHQYHESIQALLQPQKQHKEKKSEKPTKEFFFIKKIFLSRKKI
jgi:hypothetical protein